MPPSRAHLNIIDKILLPKSSPLDLVFQSRGLLEDSPAGRRRSAPRSPAAALPTAQAGPRPHLISLGVKRPTRSSCSNSGMRSSSRCSMRSAMVAAAREPHACAEPGPARPQFRPLRPAPSGAAPAPLPAPLLLPGTGLGSGKAGDGARRGRESAARGLAASQGKGPLAGRLPSEMICNKKIVWQ